MKSIEEQLIDSPEAKKIDEIAIALLKGDFRITEVETSRIGSMFIKKRIAMDVEGQEFEITLERKLGISL